MFAPAFGEEYVADFQPHDFLNSIQPVVHIDNAVQHCEHFFAIIDMPLVRLVRPMQPRRRSLHVRYVCRTPCPRRLEFPCSYDFHASSSSAAISFVLPILYLKLLSKRLGLSLPGVDPILPVGSALFPESTYPRNGGRP